MLILPFDAFTPYIKGVEFANDQNQQDIKFEQDREIRAAELEAKQTSNDLNRAMAPFKLNAATRADALGGAQQPGLLSDATQRSQAAVDNAGAVYNAESAKRQTAEINSMMAADNAVLKFDEWNAGGRDLTAFKLSNDTAVSQIKELLRAESTSQMNVDLATLQEMARDRVKIATKVQQNANATNDYKARVDAKLILDAANNIDAEVQTRVLERAARRDTTTAASLQGIGNAAVAALPGVITDRASTIASGTQMAAREAEAANRTSMENRTVEEQRRVLTASTPLIRDFKATLTPPANVPPAGTPERAVFMDAQATLIDEAYQKLQQAVGAQLPAGTITGGMAGLFFQPLNEDPVPFTQFTETHKEILNFSPYAVAPTAGKSAAQQAAEVARTNAQTASANALTDKRKAETRKLGNGAAATGAARLDVIKKPPL